MKSNFLAPSLKNSYPFSKKNVLFQEGTFWKSKVSYQQEIFDFLNFLFFKDKNSCFFFQENPLGFFTTVFYFKCFHFSPLFFGSFHCWMHFFRSSFFFTLTVSFAGFFCQILLFCVVIPRVLQTWESLLYPQAFFTLHSFSTFATIQQVLQIWDRFFYP